MAFISTSSIAAGVRARELTASRKKSTVCSRATVRQSRHERSIPSAQRVATFLTARAFVSGAPLLVRSKTASISSRTFELVCQDQKPGELTELESELGLGGPEPQVSVTLVTATPEEIPDTYADGRPVILRRNEKEEFISVPTNDYECTSCAYVYEEDKGDVFRRIEPGTPFAEIPDTFKCPVCNAPKTRFVQKRLEIAGFASNQSFGLGGNSMTPGQKSALIYGSLLAFLIFFLLGYTLQ
mmetsp:Transcript_39013/g.63215  ORF Transcript_39013/g.63215 Transcript_39013/m.63215 type:complete len:241 (-) Transcript_39013:14-736(-)